MAKKFFFIAQKSRGYTLNESILLKEMIAIYTAAINRNPEIVPVCALRNTGFTFTQKWAKITLKYTCTAKLPAAALQCAPKQGIAPSFIPHMRKKSPEYMSGVSDELPHMRKKICRVLRICICSRPPGRSLWL